MKAIYRKYILDFKIPGGTSRGILTQKETWFLIFLDNTSFGIGECAIFRGLSADDLPDYEEKLKWVCAHVHLGLAGLLAELVHYPSIQFGIEQAFLSLNSTNPFTLFPSEFTEENAPIPINGLIWMGEEAYMRAQIDAKLLQGFDCIKLKIGSLAFEKELKLLKYIRDNYTAEQVSLRVDANGALDNTKALAQLNTLFEYDLHSIEQPIKPGNHQAMRNLCHNSPLPIALDEELIGVFNVTEKEQLLQTIRPQFIILKPSLMGGFAGSREWINLADKMGIGWWITSALESNIGLNAIAQWTYTLKCNMPQGLGTGSLFSNNIESPLYVESGDLYYLNDRQWKSELIDELCI